MRQKLSGVPGVFTSDEVGFLEHTQRAKRDVFEIPYRRRDNEEGACHCYSVAIRPETLKTCRARTGTALSPPCRYGIRAIMMPIPRGLKI
jgi:hypothetical protein